MHFTHTFFGTQIHNIMEDDLLDDEPCTMEVQPSSSATPPPSLGTSSEETDAAITLASLQQPAVDQKFVPKFISNVWTSGLCKKGKSVFCCLMTTKLHLHF